MHATIALAKPHWTQDPFVLPCRRGNLREHDLDGEAILFDPRTGNTYQLNRTALAVWRRCDGVTETREIAAGQCENFEVDFETALDHVEQLVALFTESGLLESGSDA